MFYIVSITKSKIYSGGRGMESSRYWQDFAEVVDRTFINGLARRGPSPASQTEEKNGYGMIVYGGQLMSVDVYLAVPTYIRRGITIAV
jgi:hypothetical protein